MAIKSTLKLKLVGLVELFTSIVLKSSHQSETLPNIGLSRFDQPG
jgi:hypothetical protein